METEILTKMRGVFREKFGDADTRAYFSPGRVNLIGEHTDYNGGHVFPCAITLGTYALAARRSDRLCRLFSMNFPDSSVKEFSLDNIEYSEKNDWANYPMGVIYMLAQAGHDPSCGLDIVYCGDLPGGAGLSSSASIEVLTAVIFDDIFGFGLDRIELVKLSQKAENKFVGMNCGIMDQFAVGMGKEGCAILLDCNTLQYRYSELKLDGCSIVITNTNKPHSLASSAYNVRRAQCEHALNELKDVKPELKSLGDLTCEEFDAIAGHITDHVERQRARHAVYENQRTLSAVKALEQSDLKTFGKLMNAAHASMRDDYDATGIELDTLAELAWAEPGVLGSRMTGGGFGGCTVSIVKNDSLESFQKNIAESYTKKIGYAPSFYIANISGGTKRLD